MTKSVFFNDFLHFLKNNLLKTVHNKCVKKLDLFNNLQIFVFYKSKKCLMFFYYFAAFFSFFLNNLLKCFVFL